MLAWQELVERSSWDDARGLRERDCEKSAVKRIAREGYGERVQKKQKIREDNRASNQRSTKHVNIVQQALLQSTYSHFLRYYDKYIKLGIVYNKHNDINQLE